ncbi:MAG: GNAT family N-acetyltransferase [Bauldia sp.]
MAFTIRIATPEDEEGVSAVLLASYSILLPAHYTAAEMAPMLPLIVKANPKLLSCGTYYVAVEDGAYLGCGGWTPAKHAPAGEATPGLGSIRHFATHPDHVRRGVGSALYRESERTARLAGITRFQCLSALGAERFYETFGFVAEGRFDVPLADGVVMPSTRMTKTLD